MNQKRNKSPLDTGNLAAIAIAVAFGIFIPLGSASAQGVWAEPVCGIEPACGLESACGAEPACGLESACNCQQPVCGCETIRRQAEPACGSEPACGCEGGCGCGELLGREQGLLAASRFRRLTPIHAMIDTMSSGINTMSNGVRKIASHRCLLQQPTQACCECSGCSPSMTRTIESYADHEPIQRVPSVAPSHEPSVHAAPYMTPTPAPMPQPTPPPAPRTTIRRSIPQPAPQPHRDVEAEQPGRVFDALTDPFIDDSAGLVRLEPGIQQATFARDAADRSKSRTSKNPDADDFADYFRE